ncbi:NrsF family protein [Sphingomicrobium aestuariivivum]|uniref:NrsF family protein n=1 Tax=Sphingomicrobium aestuariivivum TaxID=1582356 RepID=UPI001FD65553|nr:NrsF family protein [Sphingomicrobium aestuariivivum]MCJ8190302.1 DUF1109 domain-containing protein [Sphingomicrobium aestuariivivum]
MRTEDLLDRLSHEAAPVRPVSIGRARLGLALVALATVALVLALWSPRPQLMDGSADAMTLVLAALFALLAGAAGVTATRLARPAVGAAPGGGLWVFAAILVFPAIALVQQMLGHGDTDQVALGMSCLATGTAMSLFTALFLTLHLRRGAPVLPQRAGLVAGLSAGAVGALAITLECDGTTFAHLAFWHVAILAAWAAIGRFGIARLIRW